MLLLLACADIEALPSGEAPAITPQPSGCVTEAAAITNDADVRYVGSLESDLGRRWAGTVSWGDSPALLDIQGGGSWELLQRTWYEAGSSEACVSSYAWHTTATLADDAGVLDETLAVTLEGHTLWDFTLAATIEADTIVGSASNDVDTLQITAVHIPLDISGSPAPGAWEATLAWSDATLLGTGWFATHQYRNAAARVPS